MELCLRCMMKKKLKIGPSGFAEPKISEISLCITGCKPAFVVRGSNLYGVLKRN